MAPCSVCSIQSNITESDHGENRHVQCPRCGNFSFTRTAGRKLESLESEESGWKAKLSHWIRRKNEENQVPSINRNMLVSIIDEMQLPDIEGQSKNLVQWLGKNLKNFSDVITIDPLLLSAVAGCEDGRGVDHIASHLSDEAFLTYTAEKELGRADPYVIRLGLTVKGWEKYNSLTQVEPTERTQTYSIFVNYAREDNAVVAQLCERLRERGFAPWIDTQDIVPGEDWKKALTRAIQTSTFFLACLSKNSVKKRGVVQEELKEALSVWNQKLQDDIYLIPVRIEDCEVPEPLAKFHWVGLFVDDGFEQLCRALDVGIERLLS